MRAHDEFVGSQVSGWTGVLAWWLAFAGSHMVLSSVPVRGAIVRRIGEGPFAGIYSLVALATFIPMVWTYWPSRHTGAMLWNLRGVPGATVVTIVLAATGFAFIAASVAQPSPTSMDARAILRARGITRVTRHPLLVGLALWGTAHVLVNGFLSDIVFFGGFPVFALIGATHQDARKQSQQLSRLGTFYGETSLVPFGAIITRRTRFAVGEMPWVALGSGVLIALILYYLHPLLFA